MFPRFSQYGPYALVFLCLLMTPPLLSWINGVLRPSQVVLDLGGVEIPAIYKRAVRYDDGSVELTINIPASTAVLKQLLLVHEQIRYNLTGGLTMETEEEEARKKVLKTLYPVTLDTPFILNSPDLCREVHPLHVLVIVHTSTTNFQRRRLIRETWAGKHLMMTRNLRLLFLLGLSPNVTVQRLIENERLVYGDLVQGRFKDSYHNLTHKGVMAYRWIRHHCSHAQLVLKVDDDMFVNPFLLYHVYFPRLRNANRTIACQVRPVNTSPIQRSSGKWAIGNYQFRGYKNYPVPYCNGYLVLITPDIISAMHSAAYTTPFFWVDDVYLYGLLPAKVGQVKHMNINKNLTLIAKTGQQCFTKPDCSLLATTYTKEPLLQELWSWTLRNIPAELKPEVNPVYLVT